MFSNRAPVDLRDLVAEERQSHLPALGAAVVGLEDAPLVNQVRRLLFGRDSSSPRSLVDVYESVALPCAAPALFDGFRALAARNATAASVRAVTTLTPHVLSPAAIDLDLVRRRRAVLRQLAADIAAEQTLLEQVERMQALNPMHVALEASNWPTTVELLLDAGVGVGGSARTLALAFARLPTALVGRLLANSHRDGLDLLFVERCALLTKQSAGGPFPFLPLRDALESAWCQTLQQQRSELYATIEWLRQTSRQRRAVAGADPAILSFARLCASLPQLCRARVVNFAVSVPPPTASETDDFVVAVDTVGVWMRARVLQQRCVAGVDELFVHYENWGPRYDEWLRRDGNRVRPWVHPRQLVTSSDTDDWAPSAKETLAMLKLFSEKV
jgi:hypothetical protein